MKVYVDENDYVITYCAMTGRESLETSKSPIIVESLADYTKQVRKEVCEEIKEKLRKQYPTVYANIGESLFCSDCWLKIKELNEILDQIQGE